MDRGSFIAFEGIEGCGKSTQLRLLADRLEADGRRVVSVREPGGTPVGDRVRAALLDPALTEMTDTAEMLLFAASRAQLVREVIRPSLAGGAVVLCDRYVTSSLVYQGHARGLGRDLVAAANAPAIDGLLPDAIVLVDVPVAEALARAEARGALDRIEAEGVAFHERVRAGFGAEAAADPDCFVVVDGAAPPDVVHRRVLAGLADHGLLRPDVSAETSAPHAPSGAM